MLKMQIIGNLGKDAVMHQHGTDNVLQFSVAHTDKYKDSAGMLVQKTTWVECSYWIDGRSPLGQYLKKGTMVYVEGFPGSRAWEKDGKKYSSLTLRVFSLQLCGGGGQRDNNQQQPSQQAPAPAPVNEPDGYKPLETENFDLPF